jgi:glycerophosphoryl diester phosphodiesterase
LFNPDSKDVLVVSHRGDWRNACENSVEAVRNASRMGVDIVEIDLGRTKDGELIVMHDDKVDRTTTGKGYVKDLTLAEIKQLRLRNGCNIKTIYKVPTLEEVLLEAKGKVMLNLDKAFDYFHQVYELLEKTGTADLVIMKSNAPAEDVQRDYGKYLDKVIFMPKVNLDDEDAIRKLNDYLRILQPVAIEFKFAHDTNPLPYEVKRIMAGKSRIWYNTLWDTHAGGHDDDCSLVNPDKGYGYLIENLGATILQTDRPAYLIDYLKHKSKVMDCERDWTYLQSENEFQAPFVPHLQVEECFLKGKKNPQTNEDGMIVTPYFAAVIDGATAKSTFTYEGKKTGRLAMELALEAIRNFPKDIDAADAIRRITERIYDFYVQHNLLDELKAEPGKRFTANGVIYSYARNEVWQVGDCQCIIDNLYSSNEKEIDAIMADVRAVVNEVALLGGATMKDLESHDPGREFIYPFLQKQALLQNCPIQGQPFSFSVFDGFPVQMEQVKVFPVGDAKEVVLASDGYPHLYSTLYASECYLADILEKDPLCIRLYKSTKGIQEGNCSFDDRAYLKIRINR